MAENGREKRECILLVRLAAGDSAREAAEAAGVSERTVFRRLSEPGFREAVQKLRREMLNRSAARIADASVKAAGTLTTLLDSASEQIRLQAAKTLLDKALHLRRDEIALRRDLLTIDQAWVLIGGIDDAVRKAVTDPQTRAAIAIELERVFRDTGASDTKHGTSANRTLVIVTLVLTVFSRKCKVQ